MSKNLLVIDDEKGIRKSFVLALEGTEYRVDTAESGKRGIEMEKRGSYDIIFLDLKMPGLNGVETLREIIKTTRDVPIYIITAFYEEYFEELKSAEKEGIDFEVLRKPFSSDQIVLAVKSILN